MREFKKSKRVSWASSVNLSQVRLFLSDESPAQVGVGTQDHLQAKSSWVSQPIGAGLDDNLPPGFEASHQIDLLKNKLSHIPLSKWTRPPRFVFDSTWQVVAGEESKEVEIQNQREMRILEAVYPRPSAIPPDPSALTDLEPSPGNELSIPLIPITPLEDEDMTIIDTSTYITPENSTSAISHPTHCTTANANTPFGVVNTIDPNTIDPNLLMKILNDPKWHERLMANHGAVTNPDPVPNLSPPSVLPLEPSHLRTGRPEIGAPTSMTSPLNGTFYPPPIAKDLSYYKSLVQQHGGEKSKGVSYSNDRQNANQELVNNVSKKTKACAYFNSSRGCRNGDSCPYQHDLFAVDSAKRMKLDRNIIGE